MEIVDAHMHLWTPETHPWVAKMKNEGHPAGPFGEYAILNGSRVSVLYVFTSCLYVYVTIIGLHDEIL